MVPEPLQPAPDDGDLLDWYPYDLVAIDEYPLESSVKLNGPPGTGKSTNLRGRAALQVLRDDMNLGDVAYVTYRRALAEEILDDWQDLSDDLPEDQTLLTEAETCNPSKGVTQNFGTAHAVARRNLDGDYEMVSKKHKVDFAENVVGVNYLGSKWSDTPGKLLFRVFAWVLDNRLPMARAHECPFYDDLCDQWHSSDVNVKLLWEEWQTYKTTPDVRSEDHQSDGELWDFGELFEVVLREDITLDIDLLVIDELHDAYPLMFAVLEHWMEDVQARGGTVIVGGDPLQVVNEYQGASPEFFTDLDLPEIELPQSYRVPSEHWELATRMVGQSFTPPDLEPAKDGGIVEVRDGPQWSWGDTETPAASGTPDDLLAEQPSEYLTPDADTDGVLYLARTHPQLEHIGRSFRDDGIIFRGSDGSGAWSWDSSETRCGLYNALIKLSRFGPSDWEYEWSGPTFTGDDHLHTRTSFDARELHALVKHTPEKSYDDYEDAYGWARTAKSNDEAVPVFELAKRVTEEFWSEFTSAAESVDSLTITTNMRDWLAPALMNDGGLLPTTLKDFRETIKVVVQTIHASKGSQADCVMLYDGISRRINRSNQSREGAEANEHRTWYVALSRATQKLVIAENAFAWTVPYVAPLVGGESA